MSRRALVGLLALPALLAPAAVADVPVGPNQQLSRNRDGTNAGNGPSQRPEVSAGARHVAFYSSASDLIGVGADENGLPDVYLWDAATGELEVVSSPNPEAALANGVSDVPTISPDGRFVAFNSSASNLPGGNGVCQTFLLDRGDPLDLAPQRTLEVVSLRNEDPPTVGNGQCPTSGLQPSVSDDGRFVGFSSNSTNLVADDLKSDITQKRWQVFVRDRELDHTYRLPDPADPEEESPNGASWVVKLDGSGRRAVFSSAASDIHHGDQDGGLIDLFVWELPEDGGMPSISRRIDVDSSGPPLLFDVSGDGRWVAFETRLPLDPDDDASSADVYLVSIDDAEPPRLVTGDVDPSVSSLSISYDGRFVAFGDNAFPYSNVWVWDREAGEARPVGFRTNGTPVRGAGEPEISPDGRSIVFQSPDAALIEDPDNNGKSDVHLVVDALAVLDPWPRLRPDREIEDVLGDLGVLVPTELPVVRGMATDGVTRTILRFLPRAATGAVRYRLLNETLFPDDVGWLAERTGSFASPATDLTVPVEMLPSGQLAAFAQWLAPDRFARDPAPPGPFALDCDLTPFEDHCLSRRAARIEISYTPTGGGDPIVLTRELDLVRPPVALVHGIWGDEDSFQWPLVDDPRFLIHRHEYYSTHADEFAANLDEPLKAAKTAVELWHRRLIASTQADVVGHSMGGVLTRLYLTHPVMERRTPRNYHAGWVRRAFSVGSPFLGSEFACLLREIQRDPYIGWRFELAFEFSQGCIDCGGTVDLEPGSLWLDSVPASTAAATHAMVGVGGSDILDLPLLPLRLQLAELLVQAVLTYYVLTYEDVFGAGVRHDFIVSEPSQSGGLAEPQRIIYGWDPPDRGDHLSQTKEKRFSDTAAWLLDLEPGHPALAPGSPQTTSSPCPPLTTFGIDSTANTLSSDGAGVTVTQPAPGSIFAPGDTVDVTVEPFGGLAVDRVLVMTPYHFEVLDTPPFTTSFTVPEDALGPGWVAAVARDAAGTDYQATEVPVSVESSETLVALRLAPLTLRLGPLSPRGRPRLLGLYDSGVERDLSAPPAGAAWEVLEPAVATVDGAGAVTARSRGRTVLVAGLGGLAAEARVIVDGAGPYLGSPEPAAPGAARRFEVSGAQPDAAVALFRSSDPGATVPAACPDSTLGLDAALQIASGTADASGFAALAADVPARDAGHVVYYQALDLAACAPSEPRAVAYGNAPRIGPAALFEPSGPTFDPAPAYLWGALGGATGYEIEVAAGAGPVGEAMVDPASGCDLALCESGLDPLSPDSYGWRVRTSDEHGRGPWSQPLDFEVLACDPPPGTVLPPGDIELTVTWTDCQSLTAGAGVRVLTDGHLILHAGELVALDEGLVVEGELSVRVDP